MKRRIYKGRRREGEVLRDEGEEGKRGEKRRGVMYLLPLNFPYIELD